MSWAQFQTLGNVLMCTRDTTTLLIYWAEAGDKREAKHWSWWWCQMVASHIEDVNKEGLSGCPLGKRLLKVTLDPRPEGQEWAGIGNLWRRRLQAEKTRHDVQSHSKVEEAWQSQGTGRHQLHFIQRFHFWWFHWWIYTRQKTQS